MKRLIKSLLALFIITIMSCCTVFAEETTSVEKTDVENETEISVPTDEEQFSSCANQLLAIVLQYDDEEMEFLVDNSSGNVKDFYSSYMTLVNEMGAVIGTGNISVKNFDGGFKVTLPIECVNGKGNLVLIFKDISVGISSVTLYQSNKQLSVVSAEFETIRKDEKADIGTAALNTVMGMTTVVLVLILILCIISLLKYVDGFVAGVKGLFKKKEKRKEQVNAAIENTVARIEQNEADCTDDLELVAVITAAIAAQTGAGTDSFIVRKIKRR